MIAHKQFAAAKIQGARDYQEDDFDINTNKQLFIVADGMGGHQHGAKASAAAIAAYMNGYKTAKGNIEQRLSAALEQANDAIAQASSNLSEGSLMGCTLLAVVFTAKELYWISVGDSPLWLCRNGRMKRLNADHSMRSILAEQVKRGEISPKDAATHPARNSLLSALMGTPMELVDQNDHPLPLLENDRILLASDGLYTLDEIEISQILKQNEPAKTLVQQLLDAVKDKKRKRQDNTTAIVAIVSKPKTYAKKIIIAIIIILAIATGLFFYFLI